MPDPVYIVSDIHLGAVPDATEHMFVRFLHALPERFGALLIAGDLFDFWFEYGEVVPGRHFRTLAALAAIVERGIPVLLAGGNHDAWGGSFLRNHVGVAFHEQPFQTAVAGERALVAHGDGLGRGDLKYRALKTVLRSRAAIGAFRMLHPELGLRLARSVSRTEAKSDDELSALGRSQFLEAWARDQLARDASLRYVVCGHSHMPALIEVDTGRYYINAGDWITHFTYVVVDVTGPRLERWDPASQAARP